MRQGRRRAIAPRGLAIAAAVSAAACASGSGPGVEGGSPFAAFASQEVLLTVRNNDFLDAVVYVYWNGSRQRVGVVTGKTEETFRMTWLAEYAHIRVEFIGRREALTSEQMPVFAGDHLDYMIRPR